MVSCHRPGGPSLVMLAVICLGLPIARITALVWLIVAGAALPVRRNRSQAARPMAA